MALRSTARARIALVLTRSDSVGGSQIHVRDLAAALRRDGHTVRVLVGGRGPTVALLRQAGIDVVSLRHLVGPVRPGHDVAAVAEIRRQLVAFGPDLLALHTAKAGLLGRLAATGLGIPTVFNPHGWAFVPGVSRPRALVFRQLERWAAPLADRIITVSDYSRGLALAAGVGTRQQLRCVPNGVPDVPPGCRAAGVTTPVPCIVVTARLDAPKDPHVLLRALAPLRDRRWRLRWLGDGPLRACAQRLADHLGIGARCRFEGPCHNVPQRLATSALLVLPTRHEALPLCVLEAMRAGLPVVASAVGGVPEAVLDGHTGRLVPPNDPGSLSVAIAALLDDPPQRRAMGRAGRRRYESHFSFARQYAATIDVYRELLPSHAFAQPRGADHAPL